jgi:hypothetical protein
MAAGKEQRNNERERARRSNVPGMVGRGSRGPLRTCLGHSGASPHQFTLVAKGAGFPGYKNKSGDMR